MEKLSDAELVLHYSHAILRLAEARDIKEMIDREIYSRLENRESRVLLGDNDTITMTPAPFVYDHIMLRRLLGEGVPALMWEAAFTPEHRSTDIIPARFNLTKLKALATKFGAPIRTAMQEAMLANRPGKLTLSENMKETVRNEEAHPNRSSG